MVAFFCLFSFESERGSFNCVVDFFYSNDSFLLKTTTGVTYVYSHATCYYRRPLLLLLLAMR